MIVFWIMLFNEAETSKFEKLYRKYGRAVFLVANSVLHNQHAAEDAAQKAFLRILKNLDKIEDADSSKTKSFILTIAYHEAIREYAEISKHRHTDCLEEFSQEEDTTEDPVWDAFSDLMTAEDLKEAIGTLSFRDRQLLLGKYVYGYSHKQLGEMFNLTEKSVSVIMVRIRNRLAKAISRHED